MSAPASTFKLPTLDQFDDVIGHERAIARLQQRLRSGRHAAGLILYGPEGVGKGSIARLYAAALICEKAESGPCGTCESCRSVQWKTSLNYIAVDARTLENTDDRERISGTQGIRSWARAAPMNGGLRVMEVENADKIVGGDFDALLKTLEDPKSTTIFVFLATRFKDVRVAGQSRCMAVRLRRLSPDEMLQFAAQLCIKNGIGCPELVMKAVIASSDGLPGRLVKLIERMHGQQEFSLAGLKAAAGIEWLDVMVDRWQGAIAKGDCNAQLLLAATPGFMAERAVRSQQLMTALMKQSALGSANNVFESATAGVLSAFTNYADRAGRRLDELLCEISTEILAGA